MYCRDTVNRYTMNLRISLWTAANTFIQLCKDVDCAYPRLNRNTYTYFRPTMDTVQPLSLTRYNHYITTWDPLCFHLGLLPYHQDDNVHCATMQPAAYIASLKVLIVIPCSSKFIKYFLSLWNNIMSRYTSIDTFSAFAIITSEICFRCSRDECWTYFALSVRYHQNSWNTLVEDSFQYSGYNYAINCMA